MMESIAFVMKISRCIEMTIYVIHTFMFIVWIFLSYYFDGIDSSNL